MDLATFLPKIYLVDSFLKGIPLKDAKTLKEEGHRSEILVQNVFTDFGIKSYKNVKIMVDVIIDGLKKSITTMEIDVLIIEENYLTFIEVKKAPGDCKMPNVRRAKKRAEYLVAAYNAYNNNTLGELEIIALREKIYEVTKIYLIEDKKEIVIPSNIILKDFYIITLEPDIFHPLPSSITFSIRNILDTAAADKKIEVKLLGDKLSIHYKNNKMQCNWHWKMIFRYLTEKRIDKEFTNGDIIRHLPLSQEFFSENILELFPPNFHQVNHIMGISCEKFNDAIVGNAIIFRIDYKYYPVYES